MATTKTLDQLLVNELRRELRERGLKTSGNKETLQARLREDLVEEEADPDTYLFEVLPDMGAVLEKISSRQEQMGAVLENMDTKIDAMESGIKTELLAMNHRIQAVEERITTIDEQVNQRVDAVEKAIEEMKTQVHCKHTNAPETSMASFVPESSGKMKPPVFDGSVSWSVYKKQFDAAAKVNKWNSEEEKATALVLSLRGKASELLQSLPNQQDLAALVQAMELRYGDEHLQEVYRVQLKTRQQRPDETLQELETDIERLAHLAYPTAAQDFLEVIITDAFIDALRDPELKKATRVSGKRKASEALVYALSYEAAKDASGSTHQGRRLEVKEEEFAQLVRRVTEALDERRTNQIPENQPRFPVRCWNCGELGHIQRSCTRRFPQTGNHYRSERYARPSSRGYQGN
ncbi:uncharacterized protein LOC129927167 [Biomphalaria glabrata]|uniref:Uncharacterized protein LOC129927167 n=1 Tax=Biomphalaria glabrata TaxID=6526 RepID=A0A9W3AT59_BIOGL|nr:uncharacterized protein LOC129927167 [Biomphalaria glabrata]